MKQVYTVGQVAKHCSVVARTVSNWFDSGKLRGYRIPGSGDRRIPREHLIAFLKEHHMPLGSLEEEEWFKVLLIGAGEALTRGLRGLLPVEEQYQWQATASTFEAGLLAAGVPREAVIIDLVVGRTEALGMVSLLRGHLAYQKTPVIALANEDEAAPAILTKQGFSEVFQKPFDVALLAERIRALAEVQREGWKPPGAVRQPTAATA